MHCCLISFIYLNYFLNYSLILFIFSLSCLLIKQKISIFKLTHKIHSCFYIFDNFLNIFYMLILFFIVVKCPMSVKLHRLPLCRNSHLRLFLELSKKTNITYIVRLKPHFFWKNFLCRRNILNWVLFSNISVLLFFWLDIFFFFELDIFLFISFEVKIFASLFGQFRSLTRSFNSA